MQRLSIDKLHDLNEIKELVCGIQPMDEFLHSGHLDETLRKTIVMHSLQETQAIRPLHFSQWI